MKHLGDITKINGGEIEPVDVITGGSPCQDLSVAGKRAGLAGKRSGLYMEQIRVIKEMREHDAASGRTGKLVRPRWMVWENVSGAFSSNFKFDADGRGFGDFGAVLEEICRVSEPGFSLPRLPKKCKWTKAGAILGDGWSVAWRTHDAQFWGVPQRRKRISVVADFGGQCAAEVLFERKSVSGNPEPGESQREEVAGDSGKCAEQHDSVLEPYTLKIRSGCSGGGKGALVQTDKSATLSTLQDQVLFQPVVAIEGNGQRESHKGDGFKETGKMYTLNTTEVHGVAYTLDGRNGAVNEEISGALQAKANDGFSYNCVNPVAYAMQAIGEYKESEQASSCKMRDYKDATDLVCETIVLENHPQDSRVTICEDGICQTLNGKMGTGGVTRRW